MGKKNLSKIITELKKDQKFESKDIQPLPLDKIDLNILKDHFGIRRIECFIPNVLKADYKGGIYYCLPYRSFEGEEHCVNHPRI